MKNNQILNTLIKEKEFLQREFGVEELAIFGSYARGNQNKNSDIDILVTPKPNFNSLMGLYLYLEKIFSQKVDLIWNGKHLSEKF